MPNAHRSACRHARHPFHDPSTPAASDRLSEPPTAARRLHDLRLAVAGGAQFVGTQVLRASPPLQRPLRARLDAREPQITAQPVRSSTRIALLTTSRVTALPSLLTVTRHVSDVTGLRT